LASTSVRGNGDGSPNRRRIGGTLVADGRTSASLSDRDGSRQIYLPSFDGGEPRRLTEGKNAVESFEWSPDGGRIAFLAPEAKTTDEEKKEADKDDAHVLDVDDKPTRLFIVDVKDGRPRALTSGRLKVTAARFTPGGRLVVSATEHPESDQEMQRIYSVAAADGAIAEIAAPRGPFTQLEVSPDGAAVAYVAARVDGPLPHDLYLQPLGGGPPRNLTGASLDRPILSYAWRPDGSLLALVATGFRSAFCSVTPEGRAQALPGLDVTPTAFSEAAGRIASRRRDRLRGPGGVAPWKHRRPRAAPAPQRRLRYAPVGERGDPALPELRWDRDRGRLAEAHLSSGEGADCGPGP
jgi:Tol biopolymer transport system component